MDPLRVGQATAGHEQRAVEKAFELGVLSPALGRGRSSDILDEVSGRLLAVAAAVSRGEDDRLLPSALPEVAGEELRDLPAPADERPAREVLLELEVGEPELVLAPLDQQPGAAVDQVELVLGPPGGELGVHPLLVDEEVLEGLADLLPRHEVVTSSLVQPQGELLEDVEGRILIEGAFLDLPVALLNLPVVDERLDAEPVELAAVLGQTLAALVDQRHEGAEHRVLRERLKTGRLRVPARWRRFVGALRLVAEALEDLLGQRVGAAPGEIVGGLLDVLLGLDRQRPFVEEVAGLLRAERLDLPSLEEALGQRRQLVADDTRGHETAAAGKGAEKLVDRVDHPGPPLLVDRFVEPVEEEEALPRSCPFRHVAADLLAALAERPPCVALEIAGQRQVGFLGEGLTERSQWEEDGKAITDRLGKGLERRSGALLRRAIRDGPPLGDPPQEGRLPRARIAEDDVAGGAAEKLVDRHAAACDRRRSPEAAELLALVDRLFGSALFVVGEPPVLVLAALRGPERQVDEDLVEGQRHDPPHLEDDARLDVAGLALDPPAIRLGGLTGELRGR